MTIGMLFLSCANIKENTNFWIFKDDELLARGKFKTLPSEIVDTLVSEFYICAIVGVIVKI